MAGALLRSLPLDRKFMLDELFAAKQNLRSPGPRDDGLYMNCASAECRRIGFAAAD